MTTEQIAEIRARCEAATPGPWEYGSDIFIREHDRGIYQRNVEGLTRIGRVNSLENTKNDAEFIAHARQDIPALLDEVGRLNEIIRCMREAYCFDCKNSFTDNLRNCHLCPWRKEAT